MAIIIETVPQIPLYHVQGALSRTMASRNLGISIARAWDYGDCNQLAMVTVGNGGNEEFHKQTALGSAMIGPLINIAASTLGAPLTVLRMKITGPEQGQEYEISAKL